MRLLARGCMAGNQSYRVPQQASGGRSQTRVFQGRKTRVKLGPDSVGYDRWGG